MELIRNLAFYRESEDPWTRDELDLIRRYTGDTGDDFPSGDKCKHYIYDNGDNRHDPYFDWHSQKDGSDLNNCTIIPFERLVEKPDGSVVLRPLLPLQV